MEDYIYHDGCRQNYILKYFGEIDYETCGRCDICLTNNKIDRTIDKALIKTKYNRPQKKTIRVQEPEKKSGLGTKLTQLETLEMYNDKMSVKQIAAKRGLSEDDVKKHLKFLQSKGLIK